MNHFTRRECESFSAAESTSCEFLHTFVSPVFVSQCRVTKVTQFIALGKPDPRVQFILRAERHALGPLTAHLSTAGTCIARDDAHCCQSLRSAFRREEGMETWLHATDTNLRDNCEYNLIVVFGHRQIYLRQIIAMLVSEYAEACSWTMAGIFI